MVCTSHMFACKMHFKNEHMHDCETEIAFRSPQIFNTVN